MSEVMQIDGLYRIIPLKQLRKTPSVDFDALPVDQLIDSKIGFDDMNAGFEKLAAGQALRQILVPALG